MTRPVPHHCRACNAYGWHVRNCPEAPAREQARREAASTCNPAAENEESA